MFTEADIWRIIIGVLRDGLDQQGFNSVIIKQSFQPLKQGADTDDTAYLFKVSSNRYGHQAAKQEYNDVSGEMDVEERYWVQAVYQLTAHIARDVQNSSSLTSYDIADISSSILQSRPAIATLAESDIAIYRIQDIRNPFSINDYDRFDQDANFDFTINYPQTLLYTGPATATFVADVHNV